MSSRHSAWKISASLVFGCAFLALAGCPTIGDNVKTTGFATPTPTPTPTQGVTPNPDEGIFTVRDNETGTLLSSSSGFIYTMIIPKDNLPVGSIIELHGSYTASDSFSEEELQRDPVKGRDFILGFTLDFPGSPLATGATYVGFARPEPEKYPEGKKVVLFHYDGSVWEETALFVSLDNNEFEKLFWIGNTTKEPNKYSITKAGKYALFSIPTPAPVVPSAIRIETPTFTVLGPPATVHEAAQLYPDHVQLYALVTMSNGSYNQTATFELVSAPPGVTVSSSGLVQVAVGAQSGVAIVKATAGGHSATTSLTITNEGQIDFVIGAEGDTP